MHCLLLCTGNPSRHLIKALKDRGHSYDHYDPRDLYLFVSESENGYDRIYNGQSKLDAPIRLKAKSYDAVISRIGSELPHGATILRHLSENLGIYSPQDADGLETASNKLKTTQRLSSAGLRVPRTIYGKQVAHIQFVIDKLNGLPAVAKLLQGSQGKGVMLLETKLAANTALESLYKLNASLKIQRFIDAKGKDIRAIVIGDRVCVAMERTSNKGDFRANISQRGSGREIKLSVADQKLCVEAAKACDLEFAGVDLMKDEKGISYIVEVNGNPGTKIVDLTGHNYFTDLVEFVESNTNHTVVESDTNTAASEEEEDEESDDDDPFGTGVPRYRNVPGKKDTSYSKDKESEEDGVIENSDDEANEKRRASISYRYNYGVSLSKDDKIFMLSNGWGGEITGKRKMFGRKS